MQPSSSKPDVQTANRLLLIYFAVSLGLGVLGGVVDEFFSASIPPQFKQDLPYLVNLLGLITLVCWLLKVCNHYQPDALAISALHWGSACKLFVWLSIVGEGATAFILNWFPAELVEDLLTAITPDSVNSWIALMLMAAVLAPIGEELVFRGFVLNSYQRASGSVFAIVVSALLFGLAHHSPPHIFASFFAGLIFARFIISGGSLWSSILAHALVNFSSVIMLRINHVPLLFPAIEQTAIGGCIGLIVAIIATVLYFRSTTIRPTTANNAATTIISPSLIAYLLLTLAICAADLWLAFAEPIIVIPDTPILQ